MTPFAVEYTDVADEQLAMAWLSSNDRTALTSSEHQIHQHLARDPKNRGQEVSEGLWKIGVGPLVDYFEIDEAKAEVTVTGFALVA